MVLTAETDAAKPMPRPRSTALSLKKLALTTIRDWAKNYGSGYKKLNLGISFLKNCKKVDLNAMALEEAAELGRQNELKRRKQRLQNERFKKVVDELNDKQPDIINALTEMENCIGLLLPRPEDFFIENDTDSANVESGKEKVCGSSANQSSLDKTADEIHSPKDEQSSSSDSEEEEENCSTKHPIFDFRKYGIINPHFSITLKVDPGSDPLVKKTEENAPIIDSAQDLFRVVSNRYHPCIEKWETILEKCSDLEVSTVNEIVKKVSDLKLRVEMILDKYKRLNLDVITTKRDRKTSDDSETSDSDFEEVENKEGFEAFCKSSAIKPTSLEGKDKAGPSHKNQHRQHGPKKDWSLVSEENNEKDPTSIFSTLSSISNKTSATAVELPMDSTESTSPKKSNSGDKVSSCSMDSEPSCSKHTSSEDIRKAKLLSIAPKLPFDIDLYHWEDEKVEAPTLLTVKPDGHRFWVSTAEERDEIRDPDGEASIRTRVIEFSGNFERVEWTCRAPLPSGKLCPRQDRVKCPFHGKVIGRDKNGKPSSKEDLQAEEERLQLEKANQVPDWQDPKLLAELKESTGVDLQMPDKSKRGWRKHPPGEQKKYVGLTDVKAIHNTTYSRLSKKVFEKSSMRRVASDLDKLDRKRFRDKYGDQFNYHFN
ncbi:UV-stimulated scaffold protein A-like isoform X2 [Thrips palmi]|nr:UV-stimulated scaffold protein A-like isoform X2 [Thrips palmi]